MEASYDFDQAKFRLGKLCKRQHQWGKTNFSLRYKHGNCVECDKAKSRQQAESGYHREWRHKHRQENGRLSRAKDCLQGESVADYAKRQAFNRAIQRAGRYPSVARLVMDEQRRYWREHPEAKREHEKHWDRAKWQFEYLTRPDMRLYVRQKSKRRKALLRQLTAHQIKPSDLRARFAQFGNCCAYCGAAGDMQIEHVVPISKGGTHAIGNIVPACEDCNFNKRDHNVEAWYRQRSSFTEIRWRRICRVLGWHRSAVGQLALL